MKKSTINTTIFSPPKAEDAAGRGGLKNLLLLLTFNFLLLTFSFAQTGTIQLPVTGQTTSYYPGDDGDLQKGIPIPTNRYTDHGNGSATDVFTGFMWVTDANLIATRDPGFDQFRTVGDGDVDWKTAVAYVSKLNNENYLGYNDWRLPALNELQSLVELENGTTALPPDHPFINLKNLYWSSTTSDYLRSMAMAVIMEEYYIHSMLIHPAGEVDFFGKYSKGSTVYERFYVLPLRNSGTQGSIEIPQTGQQYTFYEGDDGYEKAGTAWPSPRLVDNNNESVTDRLTGLMWPLDANLMLDRNPEFDTTDFVDGHVPWITALEYVALLNNENYLGYNDWRLPNRNEMHSLIDYGRDDPSLPEYHPFINCFGAGYHTFWTSTTIDNEDNEAWIINTFIGIMGQGNIYSYKKHCTLQVWPVRTDNQALPNSSITGEVLFDGNPFPGVKISLNGPIKVAGKTNLNGEYEFTNLPDGQYYVKAEHKYAGMLPAVYSINLNNNTVICNFDAHYTRAYGWKDISENLFPVGNAAGGSFSDLQFFGEEGWITGGYSFSEIYHTTDGGLTWEVQEPLGPCYAIHMRNPLEGYAGDKDRHIQKTTDGGETWQFVGFAQSVILDIHFPPEGDIGFACGMEAKIAKITQDGVEYDEIGSVSWNAICFPESIDYGLAVGSFGDIATYNGTSWSNSGSALYLASNHDIHMLSNDLGWFVSSEKIYRINNTVITDLYVAEGNPFYGVYALNEDSVWVVTTKGDIFSTAQASNDTVHWMIDNIGDEFLIDIHVVDAFTAYAIGGNGILYKYGLLEGFPAGGADILDVVIDQQVSPAVIDNDELTVWVEVEQGTDLTQIIPEIFISPAASIDPPGGTMQDFTFPVTYTVTSENGQTENDWVVTVTITTGIVEKDELEILIYPNPGRKEFQVTGYGLQVSQATVEIYDLNGRKLLEKQIPAGTATMEIDVSGLKSGVYLCRLIMENKNVTKKLIIQK